MKNPSKEGFNLKKLKVTKKGGLSAEWEQSENVNGISSIEVYSQTSPSQPSNSFYEALEKLEAPVKQVLTLKPEASIAISGLAVSGTDENEAVVLTAKISTESGLDVSVTTHRIKYYDEIYGFEADLFRQVEEIKEITYRYLFEGEKAQMELFGDD